eukprot:2433309-Rhodomonas_salina.2
MPDANLKHKAMVHELLGIRNTMVEMLGYTKPSRYTHIAMQYPTLTSRVPDANLACRFATGNGTRAARDPQQHGRSPCLRRQGWHRRPGPERRPLPRHRRLFPGEPWDGLWGAARCHARQTGTNCLCGYQVIGIEYVCVSAVAGAEPVEVWYRLENS